MHVHMYYHSDSNRLNVTVLPPRPEADVDRVKQVGGMCISGWPVGGQAGGGLLNLVP